MGSLLLAIPGSARADSGVVSGSHRGSRPARPSFRSAWNMGAESGCYRHLGLRDSCRFLPRLGSIFRWGFRLSSLWTVYPPGHDPRDFAVSSRLHLGFDQVAGFGGTPNRVRGHSSSRGSPFPLHALLGSFERELPADWLLHVRRQSGLLRGGSERFLFVHSDPASVLLLPLLPRRPAREPDRVVYCHRLTVNPVATAESPGPSVPRPWGKPTESSRPWRSHEEKEHHSTS